MSIDLDQAAMTARVHKSTIFRAIKRGELPARKMQEDGKKPQYFLETGDLDTWICARTGRLTAQISRAPQNAQSATSDVHDAQSAQNSEQPLPAEPLPLDLRLALEVATKTLDQNVELLEQKQAIEALLASERGRADDAMERAARAERHALELQHALAGYQRALSEQAESLAEERARAQAAELALQAPPSCVEPATATAPRVSGRPQGGWTSRMRRWLLGERAG